jgi:uncharacterized protein
VNYVDAVYGPASFTEPLILDLLNSTAVRRLRGVLQHGITALLGITLPITRFEHSVGAMILVQRNGGSVLEQAAALLHDVSHTAFSHVADFIFGGPDRVSYHEEKRREWIAQSDIPPILTKHGLNWMDLLDDERFPLLEQPAPRLCADRVDYFLRDSLALGILTQGEATELSRCLVTAGRRLGVREIDAARLFGYRYIKADETSWSNTTAILLYELTSRAIRTAMERSVVTESDLWGTDQTLWDKLCQSKDPPVAAGVNLVFRYRDFVVDQSNPTVRLHFKTRTIDPDVVTEGRFIPLSVLDAEFRTYRDNYLRTKESTVSMRLAV